MIGWTRFSLLVLLGCDPGPDCGVINETGRAGLDQAIQIVLADIEQIVKDEYLGHPYWAQETCSKLWGWRVKVETIECAMEGGCAFTDPEMRLIGLRDLDPFWGQDFPHEMSHAEQTVWGLRVGHDRWQEFGFFDAHRTSVARIRAVPLL